MNALFSLFQIEAPTELEGLPTKEKSRSLRLYRLMALSVGLGYIHYVVQIFAMFCTCLVILTDKNPRTYLLKQKSSYVLWGFSAIALTVGACYGNVPGIGAACLFVMTFMIGVVAREWLTKKLLENIFSFGILCSYFAVFMAAVEKLTFGFLKQDWYHRTYSISSNPNFYGITAVLAMMLCVYKINTTQKGKGIFVISALVNALGLILAGSMSLWIVVVLMVFFYLLLSGYKKVLWIFGGCVVAAGVALLLFPQLVPRLSEIGDTVGTRMNIYKSVFGVLDESPVFGRGFMSYRYWRHELGAGLFPQKVSLCHNLTLDSLLSHGVVGLVLIETYFGWFVAQLFRVKKQLKQQEKQTLSLPLIGGTLIALTVYGMMDTTMLWTQAGMIILLIFGMIGLDEKQVKEEPTQLIVEELPEKELTHI